MHRTESGYVRCQRIILMTIVFRDGTSKEYGVVYGSVTDSCYSNVGYFKFDAYKSDAGDTEAGLMYHSGFATLITHTVERDTIKEVNLHQEHLFHGGHVYSIWRNRDDNNDYVVASEADVENLV